MSPFHTRTSILGPPSDWEEAVARRLRESELAESPRPSLVRHSQFELPKKKLPEMRRSGHYSMPVYLGGSLPKVDDKLFSELSLRQTPPKEGSFAEDLQNVNVVHRTAQVPAATLFASGPPGLIETPSTEESSSTSSSPLSTQAASILDDENDESSTEFMDRHEEVIASIAQSLLSSWKQSWTLGSQSNINPGIHDFGSNADGSLTNTRQVARQGPASSSMSEDSNVNNLPPRRQRDGDDEDSEDEPPQKRTAKWEKTDRANKPAVLLLACPFFKYDPRRYSERNEDELSYRNCCSAVIRTIPILKQHLLRNHARPKHYCWRCFEIFKIAQDAGVHQRQNLQCMLRECSFPERMTEEQAETIQQRNTGMDVEKKWYDIYRTLFPTAVLPPSPYIDGRLDSQLQDFLGHFQRHAPKMVRAEMAELGHGSTDEEARIVMAALDRALSSIMQRWLTDHVRDPGDRYGQGIPNGPEPDLFRNSSELHIESATSERNLGPFDTSNTQIRLAVNSGNITQTMPRVPDGANCYNLLYGQDEASVTTSLPQAPPTETSFAPVSSNEMITLSKYGTPPPNHRWNQFEAGLTANRNDTELQAPGHHGQYYSLSPNAFDDQAAFDSVLTKDPQNGNNLNSSDWNSESWAEFIDLSPC